MRQRCAVTEQSDYIIFPQDWAANIFCDYGAWTGQEAAAFYAITRMWKHRYKMINNIIDGPANSINDIIPKIPFYCCVGS